MSVGLRDWSGAMDEKLHRSGAFERHVFLVEENCDTNSASWPKNFVFFLKFSSKPPNLTQEKKTIV